MSKIGTIHDKIEQTFVAYANEEITTKQGVKYIEGLIQQRQQDTLLNVHHILGELCEDRLGEDLEGYAEYIKAIGDVRNKLEDLEEK